MKKLFLLFFILFCIPWPAHAQNAVRGLEVTPFLLDLNVAKGGTLNSQIDLTNRSSDPLVITVEPKDFLPGEDGQPEFVPDTAINDKTFSLSAWIKLAGPNKFKINPGEKVTVPFSVNPPANAEQGTHYGSLLFSYAAQSSEGSVSAVQQTIGTILLVYYGQSREGGEDTLKVNQKLYWQADKVTFTNLFSNTGNVHVKPKGEVYIKNIFSKLVATTFINRDASNVLPKTNRGYVSAWYPSSLSFGPYIAESVVTFGRGRLESRSKVLIWILPWYLDILVIVILAIILWYIFHGRHWHKRKIIKRHLEKSKNI